MQANTADRRNTPSTLNYIHIKQPFAETKSGLEIKLLMLKLHTAIHFNTYSKTRSFMAELYLAPLAARIIQKIHYSNDSLMS